MRRDNPIKIGQMRGRRRTWPVSWDHGSSYAHDRGRPNYHHQIEWPALFARNILIKINVFSSSSNSGLNREAIQ